MTSGGCFIQKTDRIFRSTKRIKSLLQRINWHSDILLLLRCRIILVSVYCCHWKPSVAAATIITTKYQCMCANERACVFSPKFGQQCNCITFDPVAGPSIQNMDTNEFAVRWNSIQFYSNHLKPMLFEYNRIAALFILRYRRQKKMAQFSWDANKYRMYSSCNDSGEVQRVHKQVASTHFFVSVNFCIDENYNGDLHKIIWTWCDHHLHYLPCTLSHGTWTLPTSQPTNEPFDTNKS